MLFAGTCSDLNGDSHWLLVREHVVKLLDGAAVVGKGRRRRRYYEVISDPRLLRRVGSDWPSSSRAARNRTSRAAIAFETRAAVLSSSELAVSRCPLGCLTVQFEVCGDV